MGECVTFAKKVERLFETLGDHRFMVLATSKNDHVTARTMSFVICDKKFYFQTELTLTKAGQLAANPKVAVCYSNYQIEGTCREVGHPCDTQNKFFADLFQRHFAGSYQAYSQLDNERVYEVTPLKITVWDYDEGKPYRDYFDFEKKSYWREFYRIVSVSTSDSEHTSK